MQHNFERYFVPASSHFSSVKAPGNKGLGFDLDLVGLSDFMIRHWIRGADKQRHDQSRTEIVDMRSYRQKNSGSGSGDPCELTMSVCTLLTGTIKLVNLFRRKLIKQTRSKL